MTTVGYGPKPSGPTHPTPTHPPKPADPPPVDAALAALVADVERDLAAGLAKLSAAVADGTFEDAERQLNGSANHVACALNRLAHIESPVRRDPEAARRASAIATTGGPVNVPGESLSPGCGNGRVGRSPDAATFSLPERLGLPRFGEGEDRLVGSVEFTAGAATYRGVR